METSLQKIIAAIVGVLILFIIPVYIAFEKVDDVSYSLALKLTQNFVDNVRNKGYISPEMYSDFVSGLYATNNSYDVKIEHVKKRYDPAIYIYDMVYDADGNKIKGKLLHVLDYNMYKTQYENNSITIKVGIYNFDITEEMTYKNRENCYFEKAHIVNEEVITDKQIVDKLFKNTGVTKLEFLRQCMLGNGDMYDDLTYMNENSYVMHEGDQINVTVKNKNQTVASIFYSLLTANVGNEEIAKIYVDYGGTIKNDGETILTEETTLISSSKGRLFKYKGQPEKVTLAAGTYDIECYGAAGGYSGSANVTQVGKGAYAKATFTIEDTTTLYVYVGGQGTKYSETNENNGGYNGGGNSYNGYGGGGATDVRLLKGEPDDTASLLTRIIVAAGAGGNSKTDTGYGGSGGNEENGIDGKPEISERKGLGAVHTRVLQGYNSFMDEVEGVRVEKPISSSEKGNLGLGGSVDFDGAGAGGGGYYGGSASHAQEAGGGGGLSYIYDNQRCSVSGENYPLLSDVINSVNYEVLENIKVYKSEVGRWKNITMTENKECIAGTEDMPNPLTFTGIKDMKGNKGNGYAIIKKVD